MERRAEGELVRASNQEKERIMLHERLAGMFVPVFIAGAAFAGTPGGPDTSEKAAQMSRTFSVLHAVSQASSKLSEMADQRAKSDLVKGYAREMATANAKTDAR